ncbi:MAG: ATPase, T2SS/T4P/T4SS family [Bilophila sp.]
MPLSALLFSDLLIYSDGSGRLKGTPGKDRQLVPVPEDCAQEIRAIALKLGGSFLGNSRTSEEGNREIPKVIRFEHEGVRYRVADIHDVKNGQNWFLRRLADSVPNLETLGLPSYIIEWFLQEEHGLVLISGAQDSGKTTTASSLVARWLTLRGGHAVTFECPAELPLDGDWGTFGHCYQTEILGESDLAPQIERAYRYAGPNILFIGEIKTRFAAVEALRAALGSSKQLVIATVFGLGIGAALERLINFARELDGENALQNLADSLLAVIHQNLIAEEDSRKLHIPEFLLLPFAERTKGTRAKIRKGEVHTLGDDITSLKNRIRCEGMAGI